MVGKLTSSQVKKWSKGRIDEGQTGKMTLKMWSWRGTQDNKFLMDVARRYWSMGVMRTSAVNELVD